MTDQSFDTCLSKNRDKSEGPSTQSITPILSFPEDETELFDKLIVLMEERRFKLSWATKFFIISKGYTDGLRVMKKGTTKIKYRHLAISVWKELMNLVYSVCVNCDLRSAIPKCIFSIDNTNMQSVDKLC